MKKLLSCALCVALILSMASMTVLAEGEDYFEGKDFSEHVVITLASVQIDESKDYTTDDEWVKWWGEKFNIEFEITPLTWDNWDENLRIWISAEDMPDWCVWQYTHADAINYADQGLLKELPEDWKTRFPNLAASQEDCQLGALDEELFGGTYVIFRPTYSLNMLADKVMSHTSAYVRKDWAKAVGVEIESGDVMTINEIYDLAAKMKEADPGNVGEDFAPIVARSDSLAKLISSNWRNSGADNQQVPFYLGEDGLYHWGAAHERVGEALSLMKDAYDKGLIDPEFYTLKDPDDIASFYSTGKAGITIGEGMSYKMDEFATSMKVDLGVDFDEAAAVIAIAGTDGNVYGEPLRNFWGANIFSPDMDDEAFERLLYFMDYGCTREGQQKIHFGLENVDYTVAEDGTITSLLSPEDDLWTKYAMLPVYVNLVVLSDDFQFENPIYTQRSRDICKSLHVARATNSTEETFPSKLDWKPILHTSQALNYASMDYRDEFAILVTSDGDIMENWQKWVGEKMLLIQPVLDELNADM